MRLGPVLFPTDFSDASEAAGTVARQLAADTGAALHVVHVVPPVTDPADAPARLADMARRLGDGAPVKTSLLSGRVARNIVRYAREQGVGLIVIGTHGRTGLSHAMLGSVAEAVVRLAPCLVLTVPTRVGSDQPAAVAAAVPEPHRCIVCARDTDDLVCEPCRTRVRGEALERKIEAQRPGHLG